MKASVAALVIAVSTGLGLAQLLIASDWKLTIIAFVFVGACAVSFQILRNWRLGIVTFFVWILFEDLIRKYLGNKIILYGAKDVIIVMTYASYLLSRSSKGTLGGLKNPIRIPLFVCLGVAFVECFNLSVENPLVPVIGLRMSFIYVPLIYLGYAFFDSEARLRRFLFLSLILAASVSMLGIIQSIVGLEFLNPRGFIPGLRLELIRVAPESQLMVPRPNSVFVDAGRFSHYLFVLFFLGLGSICYWRSLGEGERKEAGSKLHTEGPDAPGALPLLQQESGQHRRWPLPLSGNTARIALWVVLALITVGLFISAQRAAILLVLFSLPVMILITAWRRFKPWYKRARADGFPLARFAVISLLALVIVAAVQPQRVRAVYRFCVETLSPISRQTEMTWRPWVYWHDLVLAVKESGLFGHGTGTASLGLQYLYGLDYLYTGEGPYPYRVEGGYASVIWELGVIGLIVWLWWTLHLVYASVRTTIALRQRRFFWLAVALSLFVFCFHFPYFFLGMQLYQNYVINSYHWFLCGLLFKLPVLGRASTTSFVANRSSMTRAFANDL